MLQTVIGLTELGYKAVLVADAAGSRKPSDHHAALRRARAHGAEIVTSEMVIFEWMETCEHPRFRDVLRPVSYTHLVQIDGSMPRLNAIPPGCAFNPRCGRRLPRCGQDRPELMPAGTSRAACWLHENEVEVAT